MRQATPVHIIGATGYTGQELVRILIRHPAAHIKSVTSESSVGLRLADVTGVRCDLKTSSLKEARAAAQPGEVAFLCLPHGASRDVAEDFLAAGVSVIDLGSDWRADPLASNPANTRAIRYGLCEAEPQPTSPSVNSSAGAASPQLVANPGCYPTSVLLPLIPLLRAGLVEPSPLIIDSKSGTSGAGRQPKTNLLFSEQHGNFSAYAPGRTHRHVAEINGYLGRYGQAETNVIFTPHLLPVKRGILSTIYARLAGTGTTRRDILESWRAAYESRPFIWIIDEELPQLAHTAHTNRVAMGCTISEDTLIIVSTLDNLIKGAAGQAVQNFNRLIDAAETLGMEHLT